jgi:ribosome biogenesis GTPase
LRSLDELGWAPSFAEHFTEEEQRAGFRPARVSSVYSAFAEVWHPDVEARSLASLRGRALRDAPEGGIAVGDWALVAPTTLGATDVVLERVLPRRTAFLRQAAGERSEPQAIAANVDRVFVVSSVDGDFNERRLERYLVAIAGSGAKATIVIAKADLLKDVASVLAKAESFAPTVLTSARTGLGLDELCRQMPPGSTAALVGSSGVGKSALVNALLGRVAQAEGKVRAYDQRGRHTTTRRALFAVPGAGLLVDTPGMRELKPWQSTGDRSADLKHAFEDITELTALCKYSDCRHAAEPGCGILLAVAAGTLTEERVLSWQKLERERAERAERQGAFAKRNEKRIAAASASVELGRARWVTKRGR